MSEKYDQIVNAIAELSVLELSELIKVLEEKFGVTAAAPMAMGMMPMMAAGGGGAAAAEDEGPTSFNVVMKEHGSSKINVIKLVKDIAGLGLKEAKALVDELPKAIKEGVNEDEANKIKAQLEEAGAVIELVGV